MMEEKTKDNKPQKERSKEYDPKLSVKTSFKETIKIALSHNPKKDKTIK